MIVPSSVLVVPEKFSALPVNPLVGPTMFATGGAFAGTPVVHASISTIRDEPASAPVTSTRIRSVVIGTNVNWRQTWLFPVTFPPGTSSQSEPLQYCTRNAVIPNWVNAIPGTGAEGDK